MSIMVQVCLQHSKISISSAGKLEINWTVIWMDAVFLSEMKQPIFLIPNKCK